MTIHAAPEETPNAIHVRALRDEIVQGVIKRNEKLTVDGIAAALYALTYVQDPWEPTDRRIHRKARLQRIAQMAVALISEGAEKEAERLAELSLDDAMNDFEAQALLLDADHSRRDLIEAAFLRFRQILQRQKPIQAALSVYRQALEQGGR